jgi:hypothetical protein
MSDLAAFLHISALMIVIASLLRKNTESVDNDLVRIPVQMETAMPPRRIPVNKEVRNVAIQSSSRQETLSPLLLLSKPRMNDPGLRVLKVGF